MGTYPKAILSYFDCCRNASKWQFFWPIRGRSSRCTITSLQFSLILQNSMVVPMQGKACFIIPSFMQVCIERKKLVSTLADIYHFFCYMKFTSNILSHQLHKKSPSYFDLFSVGCYHFLLTGIRFDFFLKPCSDNYQGPISMTVHLYLQ